MCCLITSCCCIPKVSIRQSKKIHHWIEIKDIYQFFRMYLIFSIVSLNSSTQWATSMTALHPFAVRYRDIFIALNIKIVVPGTGWWMINLCWIKISFHLSILKKDDPTTTLVYACYIMYASKRIIWSSTHPSSTIYSQK